MQFVKITLRNVETQAVEAESIHDVKFWACTKEAPIPAVVFGDSKGETRLTSSRHWDKHYAYFRTDAAPADKVGYVALTFDEYTALATKKAILEIVKTDKPAGYAKRLTGYATRIEGAALQAAPAAEQAEQPAPPAPPTEQAEEPKPAAPARRKNRQAA